MSNSVQAYDSRDAGISPSAVKDKVFDLLESDWKGVAIDIGTGRGDWMRRLMGTNQFEKVIGIDIGDYRDQDLKGEEFYIVDLAKNQIPLEDNSIDHIFFIEVIEHIENPRHFMREIARVLRPGGQIIMSTPSVDSFRSKLAYMLRGYFPPFCEHDYVGSGHITPMSQFDFNRICKEVGIEVTKEDFSLPGTIPGLTLYWQSFLPFLKGKCWSDGYIAFGRKK